MAKLVRRRIPEDSSTFLPKQPLIAALQGSGEYAAKWDHQHPDNHVAVTGIVAFAGGGQGSATALTAVVNHVITVASANDSVKLPVWGAGLIIYVVNAGANSLQVFAASAQTINEVASATGVALAVGKTAIYVAGPATKWFGGALA